MSFTSLITADQLNQHLGSQNWLIFDCRFDLADVGKGRNLYQQSHIPGAIYAHLDEHLSSPIDEHSGRHPMPDMRALESYLQNSGMTEDMQVVVYDDSYGAMASRLWWLLKCMGHEKVALLDGGWQAWKAIGNDVNNDVLETQRGDFIAKFKHDRLVTTEQVLNNLETHEFSLIDVRTQERFNGISEPIDPVAGHIPGALNIPLSYNLDANGCYKTASQLREIYAEINASCEPSQQVYMCGSGVTACHSVLAMVVAGYDMPRVYAGSWSEWIRDSHRPVATQID